MALVTTTNSAKCISFDFGSYASAFNSSKLCIEKTGCRMYLSQNKDNIQVVFCDGDKIEIEAGAFALFENPNTSLPFASMLALFDFLAECMTMV